MSLSAYKKKRNFSDTPEPVGKQKSAKDSLLFVIQKHDASHLHYDLRLEMRGVLKSWAIPKGPSLNPDDKRLSMLVEDHPYDYRTFEGIIPEGNYGAGTVIVWDEGTYEPMNVDGLSKEEQEKLLLKQLHTGDLKITFHGKKIKGSYALFQLKKSPEGKPWLLVKKKDKYVKEEDVTKKDKSVVSGKTLVQVAKANGTEVKHPEGNDKNEKVTKRTSPSKRTPASKVKKEKKSKGGKSINIEKMLADSFTLVKKASIPGTIKPMLSSLADEPFDSADWLFEIKWDGYRAVAYIEENSARIISRNNLSFSDKYYPVTQALQQLNFSAVIDGEIAAVNEQGFAEFQLLQNWQNSEEGKLQYYAFDLLWLDGYDLTMLPLVERKRILKEIIPGNNETIKYSDHVVEKGNDFFNAAMDMGLEGIMAKKADSTYQIGNRSNNWLKIKVTKRQEVVICGFTEPRNTRQYFGALLLGVYEDKQLIYVGHTGSGFNQKTLKEVWNKLQPLITDKNPFAKKPKTNMPATWVKPELVCEIKFTEWTKVY
nr:DNA ligase [Segetibacter sp.]